jgi:hypothetical protein
VAFFLAFVCSNSEALLLFPKSNPIASYYQSVKQSFRAFNYRAEVTSGARDLHRLYPEAL